MIAGSVGIAGGITGVIVDVDFLCLSLFFVKLVTAVPLRLVVEDRFSAEVNFGINIKLATVKSVTATINRLRLRMFK